MAEFSLASFIITLDDYKKVRTLGKGSYGEVFLFRNIKTNALVAVKRLTNSFEDTLDQTTFLHEVEVLAKIDHPAVVPFVGFCLPDVASKRPAIIITKYMSNGSLGDMVHKEHVGSAPKTWDITQKLIVLNGIAESLRFLHERRVIHRDLKPDNVLLDENLQPHVCDFGLSKFVTPGHSMSMSIVGGSPNFMAPELFLEQKYDKRVDVYAFGMLAYHLLTGVIPFHDVSNDFKLSKKVRGGERPTIPTSVPAPFRTLITRCWAQSPSLRPSFDEIVAVLGQPDMVYPRTNRIRLDKYRAETMHKPNANREDDTLKADADAGDTAAQFKLALQLYSGIDSPDGSRDLSGAAHYFKLAADAGSARSQYNLGVCYENGEGVRRSLRNAVHYYELAANQGFAPGMFNLALCLESGAGVKQDLNRAISLYKQAADKGHAGAQCNYGFCLESGLVDPKFYSREKGISEKSEKTDRMELALQYYQLAADQNDPEAQVNTGLCYELGKGTPPDPKIAFNYYQMAAEQHFPQGLHNLAACYETGTGIDKNPRKAAKLYLEAAEQGLPCSMLKYGQCLETNFPPNPANPNSANPNSANPNPNPANPANSNSANSMKEAALYYRKAADLGYPEAQLAFGRCLADGKGVSQNVDAAIALIQKAAEAGVKGARVELGKATYLKDHAAGLRIIKKLADERDPQAIEFLSDKVGGAEGRNYAKQAADDGSAEAQLRYALTITSPEERAVYLKKAADQNNGQANYELGLCYEQGMGVKRSTKSALLCFKASAAANYPLGQYKFGMYLYEGKGAKKMPKTAAKQLKAAADAGIGEAQNMFGICLLNGIGVVQSNTQAANYFKMANRNGIAEARENLQKC